MTISKEDFGKTGRDSRGMRFLVLDTFNVDSVRRDGDIFVAVLPGSQYGIPGTCLHHSWVEAPFTWETNG